jgi:CBS domain-containing protein
VQRESEPFTQSALLHHQQQQVASTTINMLVNGFMVPANKVATCYPADTIQTALDAMVNKTIGTIVVLHQSIYHMPVGIVTKTDFVKAYQKGIPVDKKVTDIMSQHSLTTVRDTQSRDDASKVFEKDKVHHAIVLGKQGEFMGLISSWDLVAECARDARAWPWNRSKDGRFHKAGEAPASPPPGVQEPGHSYLDMVDSLKFVTDT